jgi:S1-C subfamily serine protease
MLLVIGLHVMRWIALLGFAPRLAVQQPLHVLNPAVRVSTCARNEPYCLRPSHTLTICKPLDMYRVTYKTTQKNNMLHLLPCLQNFYTLDIHRMAVGQGSGFIWDRAGLVVTNYHVSGGAV